MTDPLDDWRSDAELAVLREAGDLLKVELYRQGRDIGTPGGPASVVRTSRYIVQSTHPKEPLVWADGPSEAYETPEEAREREAEIKPWDHVDKTRVVHRTVEITEYVVPAKGQG